MSEIFSPPSSYIFSGFFLIVCYTRLSSQHIVICIPWIKKRELREWVESQSPGVFLNAFFFFASHTTGRTSALSLDDVGYTMKKPQVFIASFFLVDDFEEFHFFQ